MTPESAFEIIQTITRSKGRDKFRFIDLKVYQETGGCAVWFDTPLSPVTVQEWFRKFGLMTDRVGVERINGELHNYLYFWEVDNFEGDADEI